MKASVIIPAAGESKRIGQRAIHKPYLLVDNRPCIIHILNKFLQLHEITEIIIAVHPLDRIRIKHVLTKYKLYPNKAKYIKIVQGGITRQDSVFNALKTVSPGIHIVLIHDAARPFVRLQDITRVIKVAKKDGAVILGIPVCETIKRVDLKKYQIQETVTPRETLWLAQTPQGFKKKIILEAYQYAHQQKIKATDDAFVVEAMGYPVKIIKGSRENIKITWKQDMDYGWFFGKRSTKVFPQHSFRENR